MDLFLEENMLKPIAALLVLSLFCLSAKAEMPGEIDLRYGVNGSVQTSYGIQLAIPQKYLVTANGDTYVVGDDRQSLILSKFDSAGQPAIRFGVNGIATISQYPTSRLYGTGVSASFDGGLIVSGYRSIPPVAPYFQREEAFLLKLKGNGKIDTTFGVNGYAIQPRAYNYYSPMVDLQTKNIYVLGWRALLASYLPNGQPNPNFNRGEAIDLGQFIPNFTATRVLIQPDGRLLVLGHYQVDPMQNPDLAGTAVLRLLPDGTVDNSFGIAGRSNVGVAKIGLFAADFQLAGRQADIVVVSNLTRAYGAIMEKIDSSGRRVMRFGRDGGVPIIDNAYSMLIRDGKIYLGGPRRVTRYDGVTGQTDSTFGSNGVATTDVTAQDMTIPADGMLYVGGQFGNSGSYSRLHR